MKKQYKECLLALGTMGLIACSDSMSLTQNNLSTDAITFKASIKNGWDASSATADQRATSRVVDAANDHGALRVQANFSKPLYLLPVEQEGIHVWNEKNQPITRGGMLLGDVQQERVVVTRGSKKTGTDLSGYNDFGVTAFNSSDGSSYSLLFNNQKATPSNSNGQGYWHVVAGDNSTYWPLNDQVSFHAYAPYTESSASMLTSNSDATNVLTTIHYTATADVTNQPDLIVATAAGSRSKTEANNAVDLQFNHALTAVTFAMSSNLADVVGAGANLEKIRLVGIKNEGDCQLIAPDSKHTVASHNWTNLSGSATYEFDLTNKNVTVGADLALTQDDQTLMMIPQDLTNEAKVEFDFKVNGVSQTLSVSLANTTWAAGSSIIYKLSANAFNTLDAAKITYPTTWTAYSYPKTDFAAGEAVGLYIVDNNGNFIAKNLKLTKQSDGSWALPAGSNKQLRLSRYKYFVYYPYSETNAPANLNTSATDALTFFADAISNWTPTADQSSTDKSVIENQDLQVATGLMQPNASDLAFNMAHQMGLAVLDLKSKDIVKTRRFTKNTYTYYYPNLEGRATTKPVMGTDYETENDQTVKQSVMASNNFTGNYKPYNTNSNDRYIQIVKPNTDIAYQADDQANTPRSAWGSSVLEDKSCIFNVSSAGDVKERSIYTDAEFYYLARVYSYAGTVEKFIAPIFTEYKLECWGASGGGWGGSAGLGGYATGKLSITVGDCIYICVGSSGSSHNYYNNRITGVQYIECPGGGCTSLTTANKGELKNFKDSQEEVLLVAGGGGGIEREGQAGAGGGTDGIRGYYAGDYHAYGTGGTQSSGGSYVGPYSVCASYPAAFGVGGLAASNVNGTDYGPQGGGGWYGGGAAAYAGAAGGGSGHVKSSLTAAETIAGDKYFPSVDGNTTTEKGHLGDGACVITQMSF